jgi:hypothetical protein
LFFFDFLVIEELKQVQRKNRHQSVMNVHHREVKKKKKFDVFRLEIFVVDLDQDTLIWPTNNDQIPSVGG